MRSLLSRALDLAFDAVDAADAVHEHLSATAASLATWWVREHVLDSEQARADLDAVLGGDVARQVHEAAVEAWDAGFQRAALSLRDAVERDQGLHPEATEAVLALLDELVAMAVPEALEHPAHNLRERLRAALFTALSAPPVVDGQEVFDRIVDAAFGVLLTLQPQPSR